MTAHQTLSRLAFCSAAVALLTGFAAAPAQAADDTWNHPLPRAASTVYQVGGQWLAARASSDATGSISPVVQAWTDDYRPASASFHERKLAVK